MDNLMTLDTIGESLPLQIKLSSHSDGVPYKMGGATEMKLGLGVWVTVGGGPRTEGPPSCSSPSRCLVPFLI